MSVGGVSWSRRAPRLAGTLWNAFSDRTGGVYRGLRDAPEPVTMVSVYRRRNAAVVGRLVASLPAGSEVLLHALDEAADELAPWTVAHGPGMRMDLLGALIDERAAPGQWPLVIADDDVEFVRSTGMRRFLTVCEAGSLDIAMPAHHERSSYTFTVTRRRAWRTARLTSFVEVGPLVWLSSRAQEEVLPFPPGSGMGWGVDVRWSARAAGVLTMAVVDATPTMHLAAVGAAYGMSEAREQSDRMAKSVGVDSAYDLAHDLGPVWRPWKRRPEWLVSEGR